MMNTRFIETFVLLAKLKNFRATARAMFATPAAITLRIKALELDLSTELIDRSSKEFRLTTAGEYLLSYSKSVVEATCNLRNAATKDSLICGHLRIGVVDSIVHSWMPGYIKQLNADYPDLEIDLSVDISSVLAEKLVAHHLDIIVRVDGIECKGIASDVMANYPVSWIAHKNILSLHNTSLIERMLNFPILTLSSETAPHRMLEEFVSGLAKQAGISETKPRFIGFPSLSAIIELVNDGYGIAAIPSLFVKRFLESGNLVELPVEPALPATVVCLCWHDNSELKVNVAATTARLACANYCAQFGDEFIQSLCGPENLITKCTALEQNVRSDLVKMVGMRL